MVLDKFNNFQTLSHNKLEKIIAHIFMTYCAIYLLLILIRAISFPVRILLLILKSSLLIQLIKSIHLMRVIFLILILSSSQEMTPTTATPIHWMCSRSLRKLFRLHGNYPNQLELYLTAESLKVNVALLGQYGLGQAEEMGRQFSSAHLATSTKIKK